MRAKLAASEQRATDLLKQLHAIERSPSPSSSDSDTSTSSHKETHLGMMVLMSLSTLFSSASAGEAAAKFTLSSDAVPAMPDWEAASADAEFDVSFVTSPQDGKVRVRLSVPATSDISTWDQQLSSPTDSLFSFDLPAADALGFEAPFVMDQLSANKKRLRISTRSANGEWDVEISS